VSFPVPNPTSAGAGAGAAAGAVGGGGRPLFIVLASWRPGANASQALYTEDRVYVTVSS
jgi:hypothetical protein